MLGAGLLGTGVRECSKCCRCCRCCSCRGGHHIVQHVYDEYTSAVFDKGSVASGILRELWEPSSRSLSHLMETLPLSLLVHSAGRSPAAGQPFFPSFSKLLRHARLPPFGQGNNVIWGPGLSDGTRKDRPRAPSSFILASLRDIDRPRRRPREREREFGLPLYSQRSQLSRGT